MTLLTDHSFPRHSHDRYGIGIMTLGAQRSWSVIGEVESVRGDVIMLNPGEMHDGRPESGKPRGWKILYFEPALIARELAQEPIGGELVISPVARDCRLGREVLRLFSHIEHSSPDELAIEESLVSCLMTVSRRHRVDRRAAQVASPAVQKAIRRLDAAPQLPTSLKELAALSGISRFQLLRGFAKEVGTTPHAYLVQRRTQLARRYLAAGHTPADAAQRAGFADQSHLTRAFLRHFAITPGRYQSAIA